MNENETEDFGKRRSFGDLFFKFQEGDNRIRVLTEGLVIGSHWKNSKPSTCYGVQKGCPFHEENFLGDLEKELKGLTGKELQEKYDSLFPKVSIKYTSYIVDKTDNTIKSADLPGSVYKRLKELKEDEDYSFDSYPMPYDIKVTYRKTSPDGKAVAFGDMYSILASPKREEISGEISTALKEKEEKYPISDMIQKKKDAQIQIHKEQGIWVSPEMHKENFDKRTAQINTGIDSMPTVQVDEDVEVYVNEKYPENNLGEPKF